MSARKIRRAAEHKARKLARKAGFPIQPATTAAEPDEAQRTPHPSHETEPEIRAASQIQSCTVKGIAEPGFPLPSLAAISPARLEANRANARLSSGPKSPETRAISAQNHTTHGLARHINGTFKLLSTEDPAAYLTFKQSLIDEHKPTTETESILVNYMAESHWLAQRAQGLQDTCMDSATGAVTDEKKFSLYMRYHTTHTRGFHKSLHDLLKLRSERRKSEIGFEAQRIAKEKHEMKKQSLYWDVLRKDVETCRQLSSLAAQNFEARKQNPAFDAEYTAELAKRGLKVNGWEAADRAA